MLERQRLKMNSNKIMHGDSRELLKEIPDKTAQMVWTDMPYPSLETHRSVGTTTRLKEVCVQATDSMG